MSVRFMGLGCALLLALCDCSSISGAPPKGADDTPPAEAAAAMKEVGGKANGLIVWSSSRVANHDLFTMKTDGSDVKQITSGDEVDWFPRFSPDGSRILFCRSKQGWVSERDSNNSDKWDLYTIKPDGTDLKKVVTSASWGSWISDDDIQFVRGTKALPRDAVLAASAAAEAGQLLFDKIGCSTCHVSTIVTAPAGTVINGGAFTVPDALGNKIIHPYGDFLLHDIDTGDGIVQNPPEDTANKLRTVPLWGLRMHPRHMHDLKSLTLESAIERHGGEAAQQRNRFRDLTAAEKQALIAFLNSL